MFPILDTNLCITLSSYPLALLSSAFASCCVCVVLIGQSVTERKPAGYRERACAAPSAATKKAHRLPRARTRRAIEVAAFGRRAAERPGGSRLAARRSRRAVLLHYRVPLGLHRYGVSTAAAPAPLRMPPPSSPPRRRRSSWLSFFLLSSTM